MFKTAFLFRSFIVLFAALSFISCGSGTSSSGDDLPDSYEVEYQDDTLIVNGTTYNQTASSGRDFIKGEVLITYEVGRQDDIFVLLESYGLEVLDTIAGSFATVGVRVGFEEQWAEALKVEKLIKSAETNNFIRTRT